MSEIIAAGFENERRQDAARNRVKIAHAASKFSEANRRDMRAASARSTPRRSKPAPRPSSKPAPRSTAARPRVGLIRNVLRNLGYGGSAAAKFERLLTQAKPGETVRVGPHAVTVDGPGLNVHRSQSAVESRSAPLSIR